jgi:hypothetical protein
MIRVESVIEEFDGRLEATNYLSNIQSVKIGCDVFQTVDDHQRQRTGMLLSALKGYDCEPEDYYYDSDNNELVLHYPQKKFVAVVKLAGVELSN